MHPLILKALPYIGGLLILVAIVFGIYRYGYNQCQDEWDKEKLTIAAHIAELEAHNQEVITKEVIKYVDRVQYVKQTGKTIIQQVPTYIPQEVVSKCDLSNGAIWVHNYAAMSITPPSDPGPFANSSSEIGIDTYSATVAKNYTTCNETRANLEALQAILKKVQ